MLCNTLLLVVFKYHRVGLGCCMKFAYRLFSLTVQQSTFHVAGVLALCMEVILPPCSVEIEKKSSCMVLLLFKSKGFYIGLWFDGLNNESISCRSFEGILRLIKDKYLPGILVVCLWFSVSMGSFWCMSRRGTIS